MIKDTSQCIYKPMEQDMNRVWLSLDNPNVAFFDCFSMHSLVEVFAISEICNSFVPERIVEYGYAYAGLTRLFGRWAAINDAKVLGIDNHYYTNLRGWEKSLELVKHLPIELFDADEYKQATYVHIQEFARGHRTLFYCDGGNKPMELKWCAQILKPEDLLVCHDFDLDLEKLSVSLSGIMLEMAHVTKEQAERVISEFNLERVFEDKLGDDEATGLRRTRLLALRLKEN
jgi:hypothetical protein